MGVYSVNSYMQSYPTYTVDSGSPTSGGYWSGGNAYAGYAENASKVTFGRFWHGVPGGCTIFQSTHVYGVSDRGWYKLYRASGTTDGSTYNHYAGLGRVFIQDAWLDNGTQYLDVTAHVQFDYSTRWDTWGWEKYNDSEVFYGSVYQSTVYGYNLGSFGYSNGVRYISASWGAVPGAEAYNIYLDGAYQGQTGATSWGTGIKSGTHRIGVYPWYSYGGGRTSSGAGSDYNVSISPGQAGAPTGTNASIRKRITFQVPAQYVGSTNYDVQLNGPSGGVTAVGQGSTAVGGVANGGTVTLDYANQADGTYSTWARASWSDGDKASWTQGNNVTLSSPTITGISSTTSNQRAMTVTWNQITDMTSYTVKLDALATFSIPQTPNATGSGTITSTTIGYSYTVGNSGTTVSVTFTNISGTAHTTVVTPVQTGYSGSVNTGTTTGGATIPTPGAPAATANNPTGRQMLVTAPVTSGSSLPSNFFSAVSWDVRRDNLDTTIVNTTTISGVLTAVPSGPHTTQIRARWSDGDVSAWSTASSSVTSTTPNLTSATARQRSAPSIAPVTTLSGTGGTIPVGTYYVVTSINKAGSKATDTTPEVGRVVNESAPSPPQVVVVTAATSTITVPKPTGATGTDTWNVYIGTDRNVLHRGRGASSTIAENIAVGTATFVLTSYTIEGNKAKIGKVDLAWNAPTGVADQPVSYKVERAPMNGSDPLTGTPGTYTDVTNRPGYSGFYGATGVKFWEDRLDTKYWFYRIYAVYSNETTTAVETLV